MDRMGQNELSLHLFTKLLFRVAHHWCVHVDLDEYIELLDKLFQRITIRKVIKASSGKVIHTYPTITVEVIPEVPESGQNPFEMPNEDMEMDMAEACPSDEEESEHYNYCYTEDVNSCTLKKHRIKKTPIGLQDAAPGGENEEPPNLSLKDNIVFKEEVVYHLNAGDYKPRSDDLVSYDLSEMHDTLPFGYPTEQFFTFMKQDVYQKLE